MHSLWPMLSQICLGLALLAGVAFAIGRRTRHPRCRKCLYDLTEHAERPGPWTCPECGTAHVRRGQLDTRRRSKGLRLGTIMLFIGWYAAGVTPRVQDRGWPAAIPTLALVLYSPWAHPQVSRAELLRECEVATTLGRPLHFGDRLFQELDARASRHEVPWPLEFAWAARTQLAFSHGSPETAFTWIRRPRVDLTYYTLGRPELAERARANLICINTSPDYPPDCDILVSNIIRTHLPWNDGISQCRTVGNLLFFQTGAPDSIRELRQSMATFEALGSDSRRLILEPDAASSVAALDRLRSTTISLDLKEATIGQLLRVVSQATGVRKSSRSSPLVLRENSEAMMVPVPAPCDAVSFLDEVFRAAEVKVKHQWPAGSSRWTLLDGEIAINDSDDEIMLASYCLGYHDISGIIADGGSDPFTNWDAIVHSLMADHPLIDTTGLFRDYMSFQALDEGAVPAPHGYIQVLTRARAHIELNRALEKLRALGPLRLRHGTLELPIPRKVL